MKLNSNLSIGIKRISTVLVLAILLLCSSCNNSLTYESQINNTSKKIVEAFDKKDEHLLKSLLHKDVLDTNSNIDEQIEKAFDMYKGESISYNNLGFEAREINNNMVHKVEYAQLTVETDEDVYYIEYSFNVRDDAHPEREGVYTIKLLPKSIFDEYTQYGLENDANQAIEEEPFEMRWGGSVEDYKKYGLGVFAYTRNDIAKSYYKQNGKRMPVADPSE